MHATFNLHNYCEAITAAAKKHGWKLRLTQVASNHFTWEWMSSRGFVLGEAWIWDKPTALGLACEDLAQQMGWAYTEKDA
jgi:hypothetical protein